MRTPDCIAQARACSPNIPILGFGVPYFTQYFFLKETIMKQKFILFSPRLLKSPVYSTNSSQALRIPDPRRLSIDPQLESGGPLEKISLDFWLLDQQKAVTLAMAARTTGNEISSVKSFYKGLSGFGV